MQTIHQIELDIINLKIQGATNVALALLNALEENSDIEVGKRLAYARPTEPLAQNALRYIFSDSEGTIAKKITQYRTFIVEGKRTIPSQGKHLLVDGGSYLTLCHSSTTIALFQQARANNTNFSLFVAETRPLYQGRTTATDLLSLGFADVTMIIDDVAVSLIEGRIGKIDAVFIGADLLTSTGFINKVGSLAVTAAADRKNIPVYSLSTLLKFDPRPFNPSMIEMRNPKEIWKKAPKNLQFYAPAFDYVPYFPNVKIICESGILPGNAIKNAVQMKYPFIV